MASCIKLSFVGRGPELEQLVLTQFIANDTVAPDLAISADNAHICFQTYMLPLMPFMCGTANYTHVKTVMTEVSNTVDPNTVDDFTDSGVVNSGISAPANIALAAVLQKRTLLAGRKGRGRIFIPFPAASYFSINGVADYSTYGALSDITDAWAAPVEFTLDEGPADFVPVIFHRGLFTWTPIVSCAFSPLMGVQRRRRVGIGA